MDILQSLKTKKPDKEDIFQSLKTAPHAKPQTMAKTPSIEQSVKKMEEIKKSDPVGFFNDAIKQGGKRMYVPKYYRNKEYIAAEADLYAAKAKNGLRKKEGGH